MGLEDAHLLTAHSSEHCPRIYSIMFNIWCYIEGDQACFRISISRTQAVFDLQEQILAKNRNYLEGYDAHHLKLIKVEVNLGDLEIERETREGRYRPTSNDRLMQMQKLSVVWPEGPPDDHLHIFVRPEKGVGVQPPSKRQRINPPSLADGFQPFWNRLWNENVNPIRTETVVRDSDPVEGLTIPPTIRVFHGLPAELSSGPVFIRNQYDDACQVLLSLCATYSGVVIAGHPGIGKTMFLYYLLALRLHNKQPTFFQYTPDFVILFNSLGVTLLPPNVSADTSAPKGSWALVDSNTEVKSVPRIFTGSKCPYFVVVAAFPHRERWQSLRHNRPNTRVWYMEPFTLEELIQVRELSEAKLSERNIKVFFKMYGPSARECLSCIGLDRYDMDIRRLLSRISWDTLTKAIASVLDVPFDEGPHRIILVAPDPEDHFSPQVTIATKYINQLLWDQDAKALWRNYRQLYRALRLLPDGTGLTGVAFFEPSFHALCIRGKKNNFSLRPMSKGSGRVNYTFKTFAPQGSRLETLELPPREQFIFDQGNPISVLNDKGYYRPTVHNHPSYDSFIYDPQCRRVTVFQITEAKTHVVKPEGLYDLRARAQELGVQDLTIRFVIVTHVNSPVSCSVERNVYDDELKLEMYFLEVDEGDL
ncbi:hypothetical protein BC826DRAFT_245379 [Russula brevipes]|nr:hypothetical protein BC826DRAFT_245379 [Russula brevipes]